MNSKPLQGHLPPLTDLIRRSPKNQGSPPEFEVSIEDHFAGLVGVGGTIDGATLATAYENGIFPWPHGDQVELWFSPLWRAVIDFDRIHIPKSLAKKIKRNEYQFKINSEFLSVVRECAKANRKGQDGTWITVEVLQGYQELHKMGFAHSVEAWRGKQLIAGIYGVCVNGNFSAESMFGLETDSSKVCLVKLLEWLKRSGFTFLDVQMVTSVTKALGARYLSRRDFLERLANLRKHPPGLDFGFIDADERTR